MDDGTIRVLGHGNRTSAGRRTEGDYVGDAPIIVQRDDLGDVVRMKHEDFVPAARQPLWVPSVQLILTLDQPAHGDLFIQHYFGDISGTNPYPPGHEFWLVIKVNGVEIVPSDHPDHLIEPGDTQGGDLVFPPLPGGSLATVEVSIYYDSSLTRLVCRSTETATIS